MYAFCGFQTFIAVQRMTQICDINKLAAQRMNPVTKKKIYSSAQNTMWPTKYLVVQDKQHMYLYKRYNSILVKNIKGNI